MADGSNVSVVGGVGEIIVNGTDAVPAVYDMSGRRVPYAGLSAGIYVVLVDGRSYKVAVR